MNTRNPALDSLELTASAATDLDVPLQMDEDAFRGFYDRTSRLVWAYLHRLTGDPHAADDLLQDAYYRFLRARVPLESDAHRRHYLFRIATNLANDRFRRVRPGSEEVLPEADTLEAAPQSLEQRLELTQAMGRLNTRERAMIWLAYAHGSSHDEIAETMGLRPSSVKTLLFRARRRLAGLLGRQGASQ
jgi:RNA polymerase sigma-70 factor (ECF subfamily)